MEDGLRVRFWGTRGSMAAPFPDRMGYGGNTSCVSVEWDEGLAVFDGGTGIMALGRQIEDEIRKGVRDKGQRLHVFVGHLHLDHVMGIPLFPCLFRQGAAVELYGPGGKEHSFRQRLSAIIGHPYWPVSVEQVPARLAWHEAEDGERWQLPGQVTVRVMRSRHPDGCVLYRLEKGSRSVVYGLDCELEEETGLFWGRYREFARDCSVLIFDAPYEEENYGRFRGFGHGFWQQGIRMAEECGAECLCISHHDWGSSDSRLEITEKEACRYGAARGVKVLFARENAEVCTGSCKKGGYGGTGR